MPLEHRAARALAQLRLPPRLALRAVGVRRVRLAPPTHLAATRSWVAAQPAPRSSTLRTARFFSAAARLRASTSAFSSSVLSSIEASTDFLKRAACSTDH